MSDKWTWKTAHQSPGAGIIIVKQISNEWKILGLWCRGGYDIPKGHTEENESALETAIRECREEVNITNLKFTWGIKKIILNKLTVYIAETEEPAEIVPNDKTGIYEHEFFHWLDWNTMYKSTYHYLKPAIIWAKDLIYLEDKNSEITNT
tara:strand:+ start:5494 stop:5943 length:450 start_codon:yes stop_codon:yes gene_type:complete